MNQINGSLPDLGVLKEKQRIRDSVPTFNIGTPIFTTQALARMTTEHPSFREGIEFAAQQWARDGFAIDEVLKVELSGVTPERIAIFTVRASVYEIKDRESES